MDYRFYLRAVGAGILGFMLSWTVWGMWNDHVALHTLLNAIQQQQMQLIQQAQHPTEK